MFKSFNAYKRIIIFKLLNKIDKIRKIIKFSYFKFSEVIDNYHNLK